MPADLLFEIGCEEIPAKMLTRALAELPALVETRLTAARLVHHGVRALGTPRRLAVIVKQLADRQPDLDEEVVGPPVSAAFAPDGTVTKAGQGFAAKNGVDPAALGKREVPGKKGLYAVAKRSVVGQDTWGLLPALLAEVAKSIAWPKSQRWGWSEMTFVRPVQWLVALFGGEVVPLAWANLMAGRASRGHRFLAPGAIELASPDLYVEALRAANVVVDPEARRELVRAELARLERETGLRVRPDELLLDEVIQLGEYPVGISGQFDPSFLDVPEEIIVTAMRNHQRYFAMEDSSGKLANRFATMMATVVKDPAVVQKGNEYVIAARLSDAKFFFAEDKKKSLEAWNEKLESVVFQAKLGDKAKTIGHKIRRIEAISGVLAHHVGADAVTVTAAARVCKADLASSAVGEFPELQGVMGRHYAKHFGLPDAVAVAIDEHWWPKGQGGALPTTPAGAIIALADRMDTVVGAFAVGLEPSGSADPFGLRRAAIGIWQILLARPEWSAAWTPLFSAARDSLARDGVTLGDAKVTTVEEFFRGRLRGILVELGITAQDADAALAQDFRDPIDARARAVAIARIPKEAREVFKRVANILDDARAKKIVITDRVDPKLFAQDRSVEQHLHAAIVDAQRREAEPRKRRDYPAVFDSLVQLQPAVAAFFDKGGVMVMDPDPALRDNRLALLDWLIRPYMTIADFRLLGSSPGGAS
ncbi:MAG: glycyl-tRNA synthetase, beta subunit [Deltaproteobacteria bacterium]|nr:glycyl-tRNA synthetase, beta subunit [Deltaproteobacteria bacterium]